jgi:hypothetical protein
MAKKKEKTVTVRLDSLRQERLEQVAAWRKVPPSEALRLAIDNIYIEENGLRAQTAYERLKPFIGCVDSGKYGKGPFSSENISEQVSEIIAEKWEKRRARRPR